mmetsp:Transcript_30045/g.55798  ORF Transcript_30045/g.55798 Transcript_30045/m.55798 type:complete len:317 (+) Transcript_30045:261-1211(+)
MRRDARAGQAAQYQEAMPKIQDGLRSINAVRMRLEMVARAAPEELHKKQIVNLVESVRKNMHDTLSLLVRLDSTAGANQKHSTVIKKLKHDLAKEEAAIDAVVKMAALNKSPSSSVSSSPTATSLAPPGGKQKVSPAMSRGNVRQQERDREKQMMMRENSQRGGSRRSDPSKPRSSEEGFFGAPPPKVSNKVVSGGRNQPLDLGKLASGSHKDAEDGVFVQRSAQEQVILDKLIPVDEATVQAHIIEERSEAIEQIHKGLVEINDMFTDLSKLIKEQEVEVSTICDNAEESNARTEEAFNQILEANRLQKESCVIS